MTSLTGLWNTLLTGGLGSIAFFGVWFFALSKFANNNNLFTDELAAGLGWLFPWF